MNHVRIPNASKKFSFLLAQLFINELYVLIYLFVKFLSLFYNVYFYAIFLSSHLYILKIYFFCVMLYNKHVDIKLNVYYYILGGRKGGTNYLYKIQYCEEKDCNIFFNKFPEFPN